MSADVSNSNINLRDFHLNVYLLLMLQILVFKDINLIPLSYNVFLE